MCQILGSHFRRPVPELWVSKSHVVTENINIYPLIAHILGINPFENIDGDLEKVEDLLSN